eukprot:5446935-Alexandrium_andersonii.AAC.1
MVEADQERISSLGSASPHCTTANVESRCTHFATVSIIFDQFHPVLSRFEQLRAASIMLRSVSMIFEW